jgi:hypothetical protein
MKDFLNQELQVGDVVIYQRSLYREFQIGRISKITKRFVFIRPKQISVRDDFRQEPWQVIKHPDQKVLDTPTLNN